MLVALCRPFAATTYAAPASNRQIADELGEPMVHVAVAWLLAQEGVTSVIVDYPFITSRSVASSSLCGEKLVEVLNEDLRRFGW